MFFGKKFSGYHSGKLSGLDILVLSIVKNNNGISGYGISQEINKDFKGLWKASAGTIYPLLSRLADKSFVVIEEILEKNRQKKMYRITDRGIEVLKKVTIDNLQPSISSLGDYIRTVVKAAIPNEKFFEDILSCFPFRENFIDEKVNELDCSLSNIYKIEGIISNLRKRKMGLKNQIEKIEKRIQDHETKLEKMREKRNQDAKPIEIIDDDEDYEAEL